MSSDLHVVRAGRGPRLLFIHGAGTDHATWLIQLGSGLREQFELVAYDRRVDVATVEEHAADAASLLEPEAPGIVIGSSFGAVIALELVRSRPKLMRGAILIDPPLPSSDELIAAWTAVLAEFDRRVAEAGGPAAAEFFLRSVLGDAVVDRMPRSLRLRSMSKWQAIRADSVALVAYRPRYDELADVRVPVLLLGGEHSPAYFRATLEMLQRSLASARLEVVRDAGHVLHFEAPQRFEELLLEFAREVGIR